MSIHDVQPQGPHRRSDRSESVHPWLDRRDNRSRTHFARGPSFREYGREDLLRDWLGPERSLEEITSLRSPARTVREVLDGVVRQLGLRAAEQVDTLARKWSEIMGADVAIQSRPIGCRNGILTVEVLDATWLFVLGRERQKEMLCRLADAGFADIRGIRLIPVGTRDDQ